MTDDSSNVLPFTGPTMNPVSPGDVLRGALDVDPSWVFVIARDKDGNPYLACSHGDAGEMVLMLERAKLAVLEAAWAEGP